MGWRLASLAHLFQLAMITSVSVCCVFLMIDTILMLTDENVPNLFELELIFAK